MVQTLNSTTAIRPPNVFLDHFNEFEKTFAANGQLALNRLRKAAFARFAELGWPTARDEDWKFTSVAALTAVPFSFAARGGAVGFRAPRPLPEGVIVCSIAEALERVPELLLDHLGRYADPKGHVFTALNTAFVCDGAFVYVPAGRTLTEPLFLAIAAPESPDPVAWHPRTLVILGESAQLTLVETFAGPNRPYFTNAVTEVVLGENAGLDHYKVQRDGLRAFHMHTLQVHQARGSRFASHAVTLGGLWTRNEVNAVLDGEGSECTLNGLYLGDRTRHIDNRTFIDHARPNCASHELYKGILTDQAHGVFNGKILVRQDAQKTDAQQTNQTLLLSEDATINSKPQLEIYADDVKCTHGATVGQLDENAVFYLQSRGIGETEARALLTFAFANDIVRRVQVEPVRRELEQMLLASRGLPEA